MSTYASPTQGATHVTSAGGEEGEPKASTMSTYVSPTQGATQVTSAGVILAESWRDAQGGPRGREEAGQETSCAHRGALVEEEQGGTSLLPAFLRTETYIS